MPAAPGVLTTAMRNQAQAVLTARNDARAVGAVSIKELRSMVLAYECQQNPPANVVADHNIRATTLDAWFPDVAAI
jgi:hypothetical protein